MLIFLDILISIQARLLLLQSGADTSCPIFSVGNPVKSAAPVHLAAQSKLIHRIMDSVSAIMIQRDQ